jgi:hypothetical protein
MWALPSRSAKRVAAVSLRLGCSSGVVLPFLLLSQRAGTVLLDSIE